MHSATADRRFTRWWTVELGERHRWAAHAWTGPCGESGPGVAQVMEADPRLALIVL